jgi:hypothetical protein
VPAQTVGLQFLSFHSEFLRPHRRLDIRLSRVSLLQRGAFVESPLIRPTCFSSVSFCRLVLILTFIKVFRGHSDTELRSAFRLRRELLRPSGPLSFLHLRVFWRPSGHCTILQKKGTKILMQSSLPMLQFRVFSSCSQLLGSFSRSFLNDRSCCLVLCFALDSQACQSLLRFHRLRLHAAPVVLSLSFSHACSCFSS